MPYTPDTKRETDEMVAKQPVPTDEHVASLRLNLCCNGWDAIAIAPLFRKIDDLRPFRDAIKNRHNGYTTVGCGFEVPESPDKALDDLIDEATGMGKIEGEMEERAKLSDKTLEVAQTGIEHCLKFCVETGKEDKLPELRAAWDQIRAAQLDRASLLIRRENSNPFDV